ncbi:DUF485 domain-containing protein [Streptomyces sp. B1I3]|uniref:DUF485 domain-containing protein n=1 Tax=Streptomyces sp. B1I3 TaxID=3042264 RepID=UPI002780044A|nr:DUF485 domain-containing protein [Streptomyces sp. B1I3]MDQ0795926.1 uncharacterized membrane protein (DUF485 family) [Streptomyces sp. B1I3]
MPYEHPQPPPYPPRRQPWQPGSPQPAFPQPRGRDPRHRPPPPPYPGEYLLPWQSSSPQPPPNWAPHASAPVPAPGHHSDLRRLRTAYRVLRRVSTLTALGYFTLFLLLSGYAPGLMTRPVGGSALTTGLLLGLCQLPVALVAIAVYEWTARRTVDPLSAGLRSRAARGTTGGGPADRRRKGAGR